jgi:hypothetical protein
VALREGIESAYEDFKAYLASMSAQASPVGAH